MVEWCDQSKKRWESYCETPDMSELIVGEYQDIIPIKKEDRMEPQVMYRVVTEKVNPLEDHLKEVVNKTWNYAKRCQTFEDHVLNAVLGLAGEAGEVADLHKKMLFHSEREAGFYQEKLKHELGDVCFYLAKVLELYGFTLEEVLAANKEKLASRHPELGTVTERFQQGYIK